MSGAMWFAFIAADQPDPIRWSFIVYFFWSLEVQILRNVRRNEKVHVNIKFLLKIFPLKLQLYQYMYFLAKSAFLYLFKYTHWKYLSSGTYFLQAVDWGGKLTLIQWESASRHLLWNVLKMKSVIDVQAWKSFESD